MVLKCGCEKATKSGEVCASSYVNIRLDVNTLCRLAFSLVVAAVGAMEDNIWG